MTTPRIRPESLGRSIRRIANRVKEANAVLKAGGEVEHDTTLAASFQELAKQLNRYGLYRSRRAVYGQAKMIETMQLNTEKEG